MFKRKILSFLTLFLLLFTISTYADNSGSIKVFFIDGLSARLYQIGNYDSNGKLIKKNGFNDLEVVENSEIKDYLKDHSEINYKSYKASNGEFILSDVESGVYYLELVPNREYEMDGILIEMPLKTEGSNMKEWFYEIEPKFEKKESVETTTSKGIQTSTGKHNIEIPIVHETENHPEPHAEKITNQSEKVSNIKFAKTGDAFSIWIIIVLALSMAYIIFYIKKRPKFKRSEKK